VTKGQQDKAASGGNGGGDGAAAAAGEQLVIRVPVHCDGCGRKLRRSLQRLEGKSKQVNDRPRARAAIYTCANAYYVLY
jgi:hypothetical protein